MDANLIFSWISTGTVAATLCPRGTQRNQTNGASESDCFPCDAGYYCANEGMLGPSGVCQERYYCPDTSKIQSDAPSGYQCPPGFYCPQGTANPIACPPGKGINELCQKHLSRFFLGSSLTNI